MTILTLKRPNPEGRFLTLKKRNYSRVDAYHPVRGFLCLLISQPKGLQVTNPVPDCQHLEDHFYQTTLAFEKAFLASGRRTQ